jgi:uncharacterized protein (DUF697 family)
MNEVNRENPAESHKLIDAVERMIAPTCEIAAIVDGYRAESSDVERLCDRLISHYSNRSALAGGASCLPGMIPGVGTIAVMLGTSLADMAMVLKLEVEMCLALSYAYGFDIRERRERQLAFLLAAVQTQEVESGRNVLLDVGGVSWTAVTHYTPRELEKLLLHVVGLVGIGYASKYVTKGVLRAVPFVGIVVGAGLNKTLTERVGKRARTWLRSRAAIAAGGARQG